ncbi:hypothetical protein HYW87_01395 [Candidatus Roizmanbacteria bacterium]|nr:hypothetical protein [Candidatus Roizmanbacteria bacterium]
MSIYLFIVFISFLVNFILIVPFINFLYKLKFQRQDQQTKDMFNKPTPIFDRFHAHKKGTPVGGGILLLITTLFLFFFFLLLFFLYSKRIIANFPSLIAEIKILLFTFLSFGFLGVYDDLNKIFLWHKQKFFGLRIRHKLLIEIVLALIISFWLFYDLKIHFIHIPFIGVFDISYLYILFSTFIIVAFANAVNITDGLDGLASGVLLFALSGFWVVSRAILDVPTTLFIAAWLGGLMAFLYFNIYPARIFLGDTGALSFFFLFAVIGLILGKAFALAIIGGVFIIVITSSLIQILGKKFLGRKLLPVSPFHLWLQLKNWEEPKIVMRLWLLAILFLIFGLMVAFAR